LEVFVQGVVGEDAPTSSALGDSIRLENLFFDAGVFGGPMFELPVDRLDPIDIFSSEWSTGALPAKRFAPVDADFCLFSGEKTHRALFERFTTAG
jgi:hypothetical protein